MQNVQLGSSGLSVSKLCFGTLTMSPLQQNMPPEEGARLLVYAYERGVRFLDTADLYETYPHIRLALKQAPDYVVSTKAYCYDRETARAAFERAFIGWAGIMSTSSCCTNRNRCTRCAAMRRRSCFWSSSASAATSARWA